MRLFLKFGDVGSFDNVVLDGPKYKTVQEYPEIRLLFKTIADEKVLLRFRGFSATIMIIPPEGCSAEELLGRVTSEEFRKRINKELAAPYERNVRNITVEKLHQDNIILYAGIEEYKSTMGYLPDYFKLHGVRLKFPSPAVTQAFMSAAKSFLGLANVEFKDGTKSNSDFLHAFYEANCCAPFSWCDISDELLEEVCLTRVSRSPAVSKEYIVDCTQVVQPIQPLAVERITGNMESVESSRTIMGIDIETLNGETAETQHTAYIPAKDKIIMVNVQIYASDHVCNSLKTNMQFTFKRPAPLNDSAIDVRMFATEVDMLRGVFQCIADTSPDFIVGHNVVGFDMVNLLARARELSLSAGTFKIGLMKHEVLRIRESVFESAQKGPVTTYRMNGLFGTTCFCTAAAMRRLSPSGLRGFTLEECANFVLGPQYGKDPVNYSQIYMFYRTEHGRKILCEYNAKDVTLSCDIFFAKEFATEYESQSNILGVSMDALLTRGQTERLRWALRRECRPHNFFFKTQSFDDTLESNVEDPAGAESGDGSDRDAAMRQHRENVQKLISRATDQFADREADVKAILVTFYRLKGMYETMQMTFVGGIVHKVSPILLDTLQMILDFASLYPNIMRAHNICFSTIGIYGVFKHFEHDGAPFQNNVHYHAWTRSHMDYSAFGEVNPALQRPRETGYKSVARWKGVKIGSHDDNDIEQLDELLDNDTICVVDTSVRKGIMPQIAEKLTNRRKEIRAGIPPLEREIVELRKKLCESDPGCSADINREIMIRKRKIATKQAQQLTTKEMNNSQYGIFGSPVGPLYNPLVSRVIPLIGQKHNMTMTRVVSTHDWTKLIDGATASDEDPEPDLPYRFEKPGKHAFDLRALPPDFKQRFSGFRVVYGVRTNKTFFVFLHVLVKTATHLDAI